MLLAVRAPYGSLIESEIDETIPIVSGGHPGNNSSM